MFATVRKITEIESTCMSEDGWRDFYTEGMEMLAGEQIEIRPMVIDGRTSSVWFEGHKPGKWLTNNKSVLFNWHISWLKDFQNEQVPQDR